MNRLYTPADGVELAWVQAQLRENARENASTPRANLHHPLGRHPLPTRTPAITFNRNCHPRTPPSQSSCVARPASAGQRSSAARQSLAQFTHQRGGA
eukprot:7247115-Pyramimonas_sp.AAC.1